LTTPLAYLLNTNILSDLIRHPQGTVASRIAAAGEQTVCTSIIVAADIRHQLTREGNLIGPNDMLIAAHVLTVGLTVVTTSIGEFSRVPGLSVENWLTE